MKAHQITIQKTAHYYTLGQITPQTQHVFIVLHGYGQLASQIIHKFSDLGDTIMVIAPEGLSRFYWDDHRNYQIVGASWMTKLDRLEEIADYCNYLQQVYERYVSTLPDTTKIHLLGFSQGGATLIRWLCQVHPDADTVILWGAGFPTDINYKAHLDYLGSKRILCVYGDKDPLVSAEQIQLHQAFTQEQGIQYEVHHFDGVHEIDRATLRQIIQTL